MLRHNHRNQRVQGATTALHQTGEQLKREVSSAAKASVQAALKALNADIEKASRGLTDLQGLSLWRASLQYLAVAEVAMAIAPLGVWWYVPPMSEIVALRGERSQLETSIADLNKRRAKISLFTCGPKKRLCVLVEAGFSGIGSSVTFTGLQRAIKAFQGASLDD